MDRSPTSSVATLDAPDVAEPWARHSLDEPFQLAPELTNALRRPRRQTQRVDPPRLHSRLLAALREFFDWKAIALIVLFASLGMFFFVAVAYLKVWFVFDDQLDHIRDWSPSNLTWRDRYKLRTVTRGVSIPSNATHIWANSMEFRFFAKGWGGNCNKQAKPQLRGAF